MLGDNIEGCNWLEDLIGMLDATRDGKPLGEGTTHEQDKQDVERVVKRVDRLWRLV